MIRAIEPNTVSQSRDEHHIDIMRSTERKRQIEATEYVLNRVVCMSPN